MNITLRVLVFAFFFFSAFICCTGQDQTITISVTDKAPGKLVPADFAGLSFETEKILAAADGSHYFSPSNKSLMATLRILNLKNLRIGGNTSDNPAVANPTEADVDTLFAFAKAAGVKLVYTLRLKKGDPQANAKMAKYIMDRYKSELSYFAIGNEPSAFGKEYTYEKYRDDFKKHMDAVVALAPDAKFCGANVHKRTDWPQQFATDFGPTGKISMITLHLYPGGSAYTKPDAATLRDDETPRARVPKDGAKSMDEMLSREWVQSYQKLYEGFGPFIQGKGLPYRMEEVNSFFHGGLQGASDRFAAALWGLDFLYWWASHDAAGLNFHTGEMVAAGDQSTVCRYATFLKAADGYEVKPLGYGIKAFSLGGGGRLVPAKLSGSDNTDISSYATVGQNKELYVTIINKAHQPGAPEAKVLIAPEGRYKKGQVMFLSSPNGELSAETGITLGGSAITNNAEWKGEWKKLESPSAGGQFSIKLPPASAAVVKLTLK